MLHTTVAQATVSDLATAEPWYTAVLGGPPTTRPMAGLIEWRLGTGRGVQVHAEPQRAGRSTVVLGTGDLAAMSDALSRAGIGHGPPRKGGTGRLLALTDPDGNRVVVIDDDAAAVFGPAGDGNGPDDPGDDDIRHTTLRRCRELPAPPPRVWRAWADVEERARWSVPEGEDVVYDRSDLRDGGEDEYRCGLPGELANRAVLRYHQVQPGRGFVAGEDLHRDGHPVATSILAWRLAPAPSGTRLSVTVQVTSLVGPGLLDGFRAGHERTLDRLRKHLG